METSFLELKNKEVINVVDGRLLGRIIDLVFDIRCAKIQGFIVPGCKSFFSFFKPINDIFIPYNNICKIGDDVILVEVFDCNKNIKHKKVKIFETQENSDFETLKSSENQATEEEFLNK